MPYPLWKTARSSARRFLGIAFLLHSGAAWAFGIDTLQITVPVRQDIQLEHGSGDLLKNRLQYHVAARYGLVILESGPTGTLGIHGLAGTGGSYTSQWNTAYDLIDQSPGTQQFHMRQIYLQNDLHGWRSQIGVIPPVKGKVSNTSLDRDGWIRGARIVAPIHDTGQFEVVFGAIDHLDDPNAFQAWEEWNYAEVEWTQHWTETLRIETSYVLLEEQSVLRGEVRGKWDTKLDVPMELSAEISNNLTESVWAYDLSARTTIRSVTMVLEVSHIPQNFGLLGELYNDFFTLGHLGMVALKGPIGSQNTLNWFVKGYAGESEIRGNAGLGYRFAL